jgi:hypothetical protein
MPATVSKAIGVDVNDLNRIIGFLYPVAGLINVAQAIDDETLGCKSFSIDHAVPRFRGVRTFEDLVQLLHQRRGPRTHLVALERTAFTGRTAETGPEQYNAKPFVDQQRIEALRAIKSSEFSLIRLVQICDELNASWAAGSFLSVAMATRALIDHVPPLFDCSTFTEVANNVSVSASFQRSMRHLDASARNIADRHLHSRIRQQETLPNATQVDFSQDLDVLLEEIVRRLGSVTARIEEGARGSIQ